MLHQLRIHMLPLPKYLQGLTPLPILKTEVVVETEEVVLGIGVPLLALLLKLPALILHLVLAVRVVRKAARILVETGILLVVVLVVALLLVAEHRLVLLVVGEALILVVLLDTRLARARVVAVGAGRLAVGEGLGGLAILDLLNNEGPFHFTLTGFRVVILDVPTVGGHLIVPALVVGVFLAVRTWVTTQTAVAVLLRVIAVA